MHNTHIFVPLCLDEVQLSIVPEGSPLCVNHHVLLLREVPLVQRLNVLHVLQVACVRPCPQDESDAAPVILPCAAHQASSGVIEDGTDINLDVPPFVEGLVQQGHHILAFDPLAVESLSPSDQTCLCQALLPGFKVSITKVEMKIDSLAGEGEGEPKGKGFCFELAIFDKLSEAGGNVVKQLVAGPRHDVGRDGEDLAVHHKLLRSLMSNI